MNAIQSFPPVILIVEDEALVRLCAATLLADNGYHVVEAGSAADALRVLEARSDVTLVFTDIQMPGALDGMDLVREVHARWPNVFLMITSGRSTPASVDIPDDGRFVSKPYRDKELLAQVKDVMRGGRRRR